MPQSSIRRIMDIVASRGTEKVSAVEALAAELTPEQLKEGDQIIEDVINPKPMTDEDWERELQG